MANDSDCDDVHFIRQTKHRVRKVLDRMFPQFPVYPPNSNYVQEQCETTLFETRGNQKVEGDSQSIIS